ncbi:hypothetical protein [Listeria booriae]|uniref:hypothetical protein n=1 Tax=Listeria booriae TaxID=1552123 RepID=UPI00162A7741|nr:hypothetical protein [Listeria booriae]MBC1233562.1 hypothetical protein [Listeria booriae]MBC1245882.1 hypothetical protein [Listeria booriae]MBC1273367.1 hypothetical protein [Listeria booriae]
MKKLSLVVLSFLLLLAGCGQADTDDAYNTAIQKGLDAIASENYIKAEAAFELALEDKKSDDKAKAYLVQTKAMQAATDAYAKKDYRKTKEEVANVIQEKKGSDALVQKATALQTKVDTLEKQEQNLQTKWTAIEKAIQAKDYDTASTQVTALLQEDLAEFPAIKKQAEEAQTKITMEKQALVKQQEEAQAVKEKQEAEQKTAEKEVPMDGADANVEAVLPTGDEIYQAGAALIYADMMAQGQPAGSFIIDENYQWQGEDMAATYAFQVYDAESPNPIATYWYFADTQEVQRQ